MFRQIRKKKNEISKEETKNLIKNSKRGVLALSGDNGYPYAIPINYLYDGDNEKIFFHGSKVGHKIDALKRSDKICFTVYSDEIIKEESWAPYLKSAVIFGRCRLIDDDDKKMEALKKFAMKYYPSEDMVNQEIQESGKAVQMFEISIEHISGKQVQEK